MTSTEIDKMSTEEQLRAMEALWNALCKEADSLDSPIWHQNILAQRQQKIAEGKAEYTPIKELRNKYK